jgi:hypothetical protein
MVEAILLRGEIAELERRRADPGVADGIPAQKADRDTQRYQPR